MLSLALSNRKCKQNMGKSGSRDESDCLAIGRSEFDSQQRSNTKSILDYNDRTYLFSLLYYVNCIGILYPAKYKQYDSKWHFYRSVSSKVTRNYDEIYRRNSYSPGQSCIHKLYSVSLFRRVEERHDSCRAINTWTPTRYIERILRRRNKLYEIII